LNLTINPKRTLNGEIVAPASKAHTHRALFAGLLSQGVTHVENPLLCDDTQATVTAISALGATVEKEPGTLVVKSKGRPTSTADGIYCGESGVTFRFTIPIASLTGSRIRLEGDESLMRRPIKPLSDAMKRLGVRVLGDSKGVTIDGDRPKGGNVRIRGDVSSQFISGLLLAAPMMQDGLRLELTSPLESSAYVSLTIMAMKRHGVNVTTNKAHSLFEVQKQSYSPTSHQVPGDYSSAAFAMCAAALTNSKLLLRGLLQTNTEPDSMIVEILSRMGALASFTNEGVLVEGGRLKGIEVDVRECPDLGPAIAVLGCFADGETRITGASRLRFKESDRLSSITTELRALGAKITETKDELIVDGPCSLNSNVVKSHGDHRIAMALSVAAIAGNNPIVIEGAECVNKSYPDFFKDLRLLGVEVIDG